MPCAHAQAKREHSFQTSSQPSTHWWADRCWAHRSCVLRKPQGNWTLLKIVCMHFTFLWNYPILWNGLALLIHISFNTSSDYSIIKAECGIIKLQILVLRKHFALGDVEPGKGLGSNPYSFSRTLKEDFFRQGFKVRAIHFKHFLSYQRQNVSVNWLLSEALLLQTLTPSSVLQKWF